MPVVLPPMQVSVAGRDGSRSERGPVRIRRAGLRQGRAGRQHNRTEQRPSSPARAVVANMLVASSEARLRLNVRLISDIKIPRVFLGRRAP